MRRGAAVAVPRPPTFAAEDRATQIATSSIESPIGKLRIAVTPSAVVRIDLERSSGSGFSGWLQHHLPDAERVAWLPMLDKARDEIDEYFAGRRREFTVPFERHGTDFQLRVWDALCTIPFGETRSYAQIAQQAGSPRGFRAVGLANGANPLPLIIPCHRVIASGGKLGGYGGGLDAKRRLLAFEKSAAGDALL